MTNRSPSGSDEAGYILVTDELFDSMVRVVSAAREYEVATEGRRKIGITGEVGEILACKKMNLKLTAHPRSQGYDAVDSENQRVQIKTRRSETQRLPSDQGTVSRFSEHPFDYALLVILDSDYGLTQIWRADYDSLEPLIESRPKRDPQIFRFKQVAEKIFQG